MRHAGCAAPGFFQPSRAAIGLIVLLSLCPAMRASGATKTASSVAELQSLVNSAVAGDILVLADKDYVDNSLTIGASNITVRAATPGGVKLNGTNAIKITGSYVTFSGFQFTSGGIPGFVIEVSGSHNLLTQLNFNGYSAQKYIVIDAGSQYNEVAYSNFENKPASPAGNLIHVAAHASIPGYHRVRYSSFQNMPGAGGDNGNEAIRLSNGAQSAYIARTVVEFNYFANTGGGDSEAISVKCRENTLRYNTFTRNPNAMMVFRNGNDNIAYGNFFIDAGGIRVKEANNIYVYSNYFERSGVGGTMNAVTYDYVSGNLKNVNFLHNTFVDSGVIDLSSGATGNTWANNIFKRGWFGTILTGSVAGISWAGNIYDGTLGVSIPSGMKSADPKLLLNSDGYYALSPSSPAIDAASDAYPVIPDIPGVDDDPLLLLDASGQTRPAARTLKDVGADEFASAGVVNTDPMFNHPLTLSEVGPSYLGGPGGEPPPDAAPTLDKPTSLSATEVDLRWANHASNAAGIRILRCTGVACAPSAIIASLAATATGYIDNLAAANTTYGYAVAAFNGAGVTVSNVVYATTPLPLPPTAPNFTSAAGVSATEIALTWSNTASNAAGTRVLRCAGTACTPTTAIATLAATATSYNDTGLGPMQSLTYAIEAFNAGGWSDSSAMSAATQNVPAAPVLSVGSATRNSLTLTWTEASTQVTGFSILCCTGSGCTPTVIASVGSAARSYTNSGLSRRTTYTYRVRANNGGAGTLSTVVLGSTI